MQHRLCTFAALRLCVSLFAIAACTAAQAELFKPEERFVGMLNDGARVHADRVVNWYDEKVQPTLAGKALFDAGNPFRWVIDQSVPLSSPPQASIEFFGGDCLPARVIDYQMPQSDTPGSSVPVLIVEPLVSVDLPGRPVSPYLRLNPEWVRRIVFERKSDGPTEFQPGTAFLHDGSQIRFRAARWGQGVVSLLTEGGVQSLLLSQIAELHMAKRDVWDVWFEQLATLLPDLNGRLIQCESSTGVRITTSTQRFRPRYYGDKNKSENWFPLLQPAWSFDPITLPFQDIRSWRFFAPESLPLTAFEADASRETPVFSAGWNWRSDRGVQNTPLQNSSVLAGWGFGVHAPTELRLALNRVVTGVRCRVGLDQSAGQGGCARARVALSSAPDNPIWQSDVLVGSTTASDSGWINIAEQSGDVSLSLVADPMFEGRPSGTDPFDIRDSLNWMEPEWRIDRAKLEEELQSRFADRIPGLQRWKLAATVPGADNPHTNESGLNIENVWDVRYPSDPSVDLTFRPAGEVMTLSRTLKVGRKQRWLAVTVHNRRAGAGRKSAQIRVNGRALLEDEIPLVNNRAVPNPLLVLVEEFAGKSIDVDVVLMTSGESPQLDWGGAHLFEQPPGIVRLLDDNGEIIEHFVDGEGELTLSTESPYHGTSSFKLTGGDALRDRLPGVNHPIREFPQLGEFRYLSFAWKVKPGGERRLPRGGVGLQIGHDGQLGIPRLPGDVRRRRAVHINALTRVRARGPRAGQVVIPDDRGAQFGYQYVAGTVDEDLLALRLDRQTTDEWKLFQRDLFAEFGAFNLTGLGLRLFEGEAAWFDQVYLYRTQDDYQWIQALKRQAQPHADPNVLAAAGHARDYGRVFSTVAPQFSVQLSGEPVLQLKEFRGRQNVVRTMPPTKDEPCMIRAPVTVPAGKKTVLRLSVSHQTDADWLLIVSVAGKELFRSNVDTNTAKEGWLDHEVDLSGYAGQTIVVNIQNRATGWHYEHGYWSRLEVVSE